ncbi:unnamed protein product, partial [Discosporangium mesarthrocarpum]
RAGEGGVLLAQEQGVGLGSGLELIWAEVADAPKGEEGVGGLASSLGQNLGDDATPEGGPEGPEAEEESPLRLWGQGQCASPKSPLQGEEANGGESCSIEEEEGKGFNEDLLLYRDELHSACSACEQGEGEECT